MQVITDIHIIIGSVTGTAEGTARYISKHLKSQLFERVTNHSEPEAEAPTTLSLRERLRMDPSLTLSLNRDPTLDDLADHPSRLVIFCVSNTGVGVLPDNLHRLTVQLSNAKSALAHCYFLLINFGDSSFKTFGQSGRTLHGLLARAGATSIGQPLLIDAMHCRYPKLEALKWLIDQLSPLASIESK